MAVTNAQPISQLVLNLVARLKEVGLQLARKSTRLSSLAAASFVATSPVERDAGEQPFGGAATGAAQEAPDDELGADEAADERQESSDESADGAADADETDAAEAAEDETGAASSGADEDDADLDLLQEVPKCMSEDCSDLVSGGANLNTQLVAQELPEQDNSAAANQQPVVGAAPPPPPPLVTTLPADLANRYPPSIELDTNSLGHFQSPFSSSSSSAGTLQVNRLVQVAHLAIALAALLGSQLRVSRSL